MNLQRCKYQLQETLSDAPQLAYDLSVLTRTAFGDQKQICLDEFGWSSQLQLFLYSDEVIQKPLSANEHNIWEDIDDTLPNQEGGALDTWSKQESIGETNSELWTELLWWLGDIAQTWLWYVKQIGIIIALALLWYIVWRLIKYVFEFIYDVFNARRMVFMRVLLPRWDSKSDREIQKELAKDMKEKIWRMSQVYKSMHKLGELWFSEWMMDWLFNKPKFTLAMAYTEWQLSFVVWTYPEYQKILEWSIAAQFSSVSLEQMPTPNFYGKKYHDILAIEPKKDPMYPIRIFKQLEDDPMNNIVDSIAKVGQEDELYLLRNVKPVGNWFNKKAKKRATWLYRNDKTYVKKDPIWKAILLSPLKIVRFLSGSKKDPMNDNELKVWGQSHVRMLKSQEDSINTMWEEAASQAFQSSFLVISWSDDQKQASDNVLNLFASTSVYTDEYNNEFDKSDIKADLLEFLFKPLWKFASKFFLPDFFFQRNIFSANELTSLFHLPDSLYNRSPIVRRLDYKMIGAPDNAPQLEDENEDFAITGIVAESYKKGDMDKILAGVRHNAVTKYDKPIITKEKVDDTYVATPWEEIITTDDGDKVVVRKKEDKRNALKTYKDWILLWVNVYRNKYTPIYMKRDDRTRHHYIVGKSGTGKSVYISALARQDIWNGDGVCVIDPHGDLAEEILEYIPKHRAKDVIYFDAGNEDRPMWLNLFEIKHIAEADRAVNDAVEMFVKMFGPEIFGPRIQEYFKYGSLTLLEDMEEGATLIDVPRLFTDEAYRAYKTARVKNPVVRNFREKTYNAMGDREKQEIIPYFTSKFVSFITNSLIRNIIGQTKSWFDFEDVMNNQKILLINLSKGKIWQLNAQLLGMIMVSKIYNWAMARAKIPKKERKDFYLYVDEFQNFVTDTFADILSEARKYRLNLIMAHQFIAQLDSNAGNNVWEGKSKVKDAVFGNVGTMQSFKVGAPDAEFLEKEYQPVLSAQDILGISNYKAYIKLNIDNATSRPFSMNSIFTQEYRNKKVRDILKEYSAKKYGRKKEFVDAEIAARIGITWEEEPTESSEPPNDFEIPPETWEQTGEWPPEVAESESSG